MDWTRGPTIGRGSSATVSIATANRSGQVLAVKSAELSQSEFLKREKTILASLTCPQIVAYKGCDITSENGKLLYNLLMEYAPCGTITDAIRDNGGRLDEKAIQFYAREILSGIEYLHSNGIVHCDIKTHNILVMEKGVKIADLGCARQVHEILPISGTPLFMGPEVARGERQGFSADIWAVGCTVIEMATGRAPWADVSDTVSVLYRIGFSNDLPEIPSFLSKQGKDFLSKCLKKDPDERWSARELLNHPFIEESEGLLSKEARFCNLYTPTSVLDQVFWEAMEDQETPRNLNGSSLSDKLAERIQLMSEDKLGLPNWHWDENWVTVRYNSIEELDSIHYEQHHDTFDVDEPTNTTRQSSTICVFQDCINELKKSSELGSCDNSNGSKGSNRDRESSSVMISGCILSVKCQRFSFKSNKNQILASHFFSMPIIIAFRFLF